MRAFFWILPFLCSFAIAAEVSTTPPDWFGELLKPHLTPFDQLDLEPGEALTKDEPGVIILSESISRIRPNGAKDVVFHYVYRPLTEKGVKQIQEERFTFSAERQKMHLVRARTISPEGKVTEAAKEGIFLQRPEGDRSSSIYDDSEDLVIIYSDVKVGSMVEVIAVREELEPRVEGEASGAMGWGERGWPTGQRRQVVGVDSKMNERFQVVPIGKGVPAPKISEANELTWYDWSVRNLESRKYEINRTSTYQTGPATWYTTFESWEQVGQWYGKLVEPKGLMESPLREEVEKAVGDLTEPREILDALYPLAAKEVRYTGLEFGHSGISPYSCNQVWDRKYGDCKDKSTLLVAMLRSRGISAWVGLVNTDDSGLIPKEAPGTRMFDHAIAIVDLDPGEGEELVFCDPTISYGKAGMLAPSSADREVLLASPEGGRLVKSPKADAGSYHYDFEIEMDEAGRVSGWLNWKSSGYYAVSTASSYDGMDRESLRSRMGSLVRNFFPSADVVDFEIPVDLSPGTSECLIKIFFTTAPGEVPAGGNIPVNFPSSGTILMNYGDQKVRESNYFQWRDVISVSMSLQVAEGLVPVALHPPLQALSPGYHIDAKWSFKPALLQADLKIQCLKSLLDPEEVLAAQQASRAWAQWSAQPLLLKAGEDWKAPAPDAEIKLPLMPSGQGQLALVKRWYPLSQESKRRKLALEKVLQLFPDDPETRYDTRLALAYIDYHANRFEEAGLAYQKLAAKRPTGVSVESYSLAHYMMGYCAYDTKGFESAACSFERSANLDGLSTFRKGWGLTGQAQSLLRAGQLDEALAIFQAAEKIESNHRVDLLKDFTHCLLKLEKSEEAVATWERLMPVLGEETMNVLATLAKEPADPLLASNEQLKKFFEMLKPKLGKEEAVTLETLVSDFTYHREKLKSASELRTKLLALFEKTSPDFLPKDLHESLADQATYKEKMDGFLESDAGQWWQHCYGYLARFEVDEDFTTFFWNVMRHVKWKEKSLPEVKRVVMKELVHLSELIPHQDDNYWESRYTIVEWLGDRKEWRMAEEVLRAATEDPLFSDEFAGSFWRGRGVVLEHLGQWEEAVKVHLHRKEEKMESARSCDQIMRAGWILARLGRLDEALETWSLLKEVPKSLYEPLDDSELIEEAALLAATPDKTKAYWKKTEAWWDETLADYLETNDLKIPSSPLLSDHSQEVILAQLVEKKVAEMSLDELNEIVTVVLSGARWFPSFTSRVRDLFESLVRPVTVAKNEDFRRVALALFETVNAGSEEAQVAAAGQAHFYKIVLKTEDAREHGFRLVERLKGTTFRGARELALRRLAATAIRENKDLEKVENLLREVWKAEPQGAVDIGVSISQVLEARGEVQEAIDFAKEMLLVPVIKDSPKSVKGVELFLEKLEGESKEKRAFIARLEKIHESHPVPWLAHVSPKELGEERFEDPADFLRNGGDERHPLEDYKWGVLLLKSNLITKEQRPFVFEKLLAFHLDDCLKSSESRTIVDEVFNDEFLPEAFRRTLVWKVAVDASFKQGDEKRVKELAAHPLCEGFNDELRIEGFQDLIATTRAINGTAQEQVAQMKAFIERGDLNKVTSGCVATITQAIYRLMNAEANREVEKLLKSTKYDGLTSREMRQEAFRYRKAAAETSERFQFIPILKSAFKERLAELAKEAPEDWQDFRDYGDGLGLDHLDEARIYAKLILEGAPARGVQETVWQSVIPYLLVTDEMTLDGEALKRFSKCLDQIESEETVTFLFERASILPYFSEVIREESLKAWGPWVEKRKDLDLADSYFMSRFVSGLLSPSDDELKRLARKFSRQDDAATWNNDINLLKMLLDRAEQAPLKLLLQNLPEDAYEIGPIATMALQGYRQLGEEDEVEFLEEELRASIPRWWMRAWHQKNVYAYQSAVAAHWLVERKKGGPIPFWMREIPKTMRLPVERVRGQLLLLMTEGKWPEYEELLKSNLDLLEEAEGGVLLTCGDLGLKREGAREKAQKILHSPDKRDSYTLQLREMLREK